MAQFVAMQKRSTWSQLVKEEEAIKRLCLPLNQSDLVYLQDLGSGSTARVTLVLHKGSLTLLALKHVAVTSSTLGRCNEDVDPQRIAAFKTELDVSFDVKLDCPQLLRCSGAFLCPRATPVLVSEYISHGSLSAFMHRNAEAGAGNDGQTNSDNTGHALSHVPSTYAAMEPHNSPEITGSTELQGASDPAGTISNWNEEVRGVLKGDSPSRMHRAKALPLALLLHVGKEILRALWMLHGHHFYHRDIKPENILIDQTGRVALGDLGMVLSLQRSFLQTKERGGTLSYLSPERFEGKNHAAPSDVWSFGLVMVVLATGASLPRTNMRLALPTAYCSEVRAWAQTALALAQADPLLIDLVNQCLLIDKNQRPSASELLEHAFFAQPGDNVNAAGFGNACWRRTARERRELLEKLLRALVDEANAPLAAHVRAWAAINPHPSCSESSNSFIESNNNNYNNNTNNNNNLPSPNTSQNDARHNNNDRTIHNKDDNVCNITKEAKAPEAATKKAQSTRAATTSTEDTGRNTQDILGMAAEVNNDIHNIWYYDYYYFYYYIITILFAYLYFLYLFARLFLLAFDVFELISIDVDIYVCVC
jgi:serine/threonine protein kinase